MANDIYYGVLGNKHVAIEGAAGLGKTVTCLSALLPFCERENVKILYAARTHTQIQRVIEELSTIYKVKGHELTGISLYGRANMCLHPDVQEAVSLEAMDLCAILRRTKKCNWYEGLKTKEIEQVSGCFTAEYLRNFGIESDVCPYYLSKRLLQHCDVIALTYGYLINPFIRSLLFKTLETTIDKCILVFDECHNLPQQAMQSMSIGEALHGLKRALREYNKYDATGEYAVIGKTLKHFQSYLQTFQEEYGEPLEGTEIGIDPSTIVEHFNNFLSKNNISDLYLFTREIRQFGRRIKKIKMEAKKNSHSSVYHFGNFLEHLLTTFKDPQYLHYIILHRKRIQYYIRCIDCRGILRPLQQARNIISMSGTLEPISAYLDICGFPSESRQRVLPSPFHHKNVRVLSCRDIELTYHNRTAPQYKRLAEKCLEVIRATPGNTALFCASYEVLDGLLKTPLKQEVRQLKRPFYYEKKDVTSRENSEMVANFKTAGHEGKKAVLVGVCGGRNSEGVDFPGSEMLSVVILGIPLARMTHSVHALITYYTNQFGLYKGKEYAYTLPAFRRANQAAGRPIRTLKDHGIIVLLDKRYFYPFYRRYLSSWINENMIILDGRPGTMEEAVSNFYLSQ